MENRTQKTLSLIQDAFFKGNETAKEDELRLIQDIGFENDDTIDDSTSFDNKNTEDGLSDKYDIFGGFFLTYFINRFVLNKESFISASLTMIFLSNLTKNWNHSMANDRNYRFSSQERNSNKATLDFQTLTIII